MAADWSALTSFLRGKREQITLSWRELEDIVGGMPASSIDHAAWWGGDRPHTRAWRAAGYEVASKRPGVAVTFRRIGGPPEPGPSRTSPVSTREPAAAAAPDGRRIVLVSCGKAKRSEPAAAKDLYVSPRFQMARAYAELVGDSWFILSAEHGLVAPDEWLAPYERYLPDTSREYRQAWGEWVVARLELLVGSLKRVVLEIHAGEAYLQPILSVLERRGAQVQRPLRGLTAGQWLSWYRSRLVEAPTEAERVSVFSGDVGPVISTLSDPAKSYSAGELAALERLQLDGCGLYSWFVDEAGAADLAKGLGHPVSAGLVYVGQTGATRWPSGLRSDSTLLKRIKNQHLRGRRSASTLRRTFGAILDVAYGAPVIREDLSTWMADHLRVVPVLIEDADSLGDLERQVVQVLDPPLNLEHLGLSPGRAALKGLRVASDRDPID